MWNGARCVRCMTNVYSVDHMDNLVDRKASGDCTSSANIGIIKEPCPLYTLLRTGKASRCKKSGHREKQSEREVIMQRRGIVSFNTICMTVMTAYASKPGSRGDRHQFRPGDWTMYQRLGLRDNEAKIEDE